MQPDVEHLTHAQLLKLADDLNIEITMFQLAREVLTLVPDDYDDVSANISNQINYNLDDLGRQRFKVYANMNWN